MSDAPLGVLTETTWEAGGGRLRGEALCLFISARGGGGSGGITHLWKAVSLAALHIRVIEGH